MAAHQSRLTAISSGNATTAARYGPSFSTSGASSSPVRSNGTTCCLASICPSRHDGITTATALFYRGTSPAASCSLSYGRTATTSNTAANLLLTQCNNGTGSTLAGAATFVTLSDTLLLPTTPLSATASSASHLCLHSLPLFRYRILLPPCFSVD